MIYNTGHKPMFWITAFRCCYCFYWNPARKQRPTAPRLPAGPPASAATASSTESTDDESSASQVSTAARKSAPSAAVKANPSQLPGQARPQTTAPEGDTKSDKNPPVESNDVPADPETREPSGTEENSADEETEIFSQAKGNLTFFVSLASRETPQTYLHRDIKERL